jgi:hypothetical protein
VTQKFVHRTGWRGHRKEGGRDQGREIWSDGGERRLGVHKWCLGFKTNQVPRLQLEVTVRGSINPQPHITTAGGCTGAASESHHCRDPG